MLQIILLIIGFGGLIKRKIKVSSKKQISGAPVIVLSVFYILAGLIPFFIPISGYDLVTIGILFVVTLVVVLFAKGEN